MAINISGKIFAKDREFTFDSFTRDGITRLEVYYKKLDGDSFDFGIFKSLDELVENIERAFFKGIENKG